MKTDINLKKWLPILFGTFICTSFMYIYNSDFIILYAVSAFLIQWYVFGLLKWGSENKASGPLTYIMTVSGIVFLSMVLISSKGNFWDFMLWFLSPQSVVEHSEAYNIAIFLDFSFFAGSALYYYTQRYYRIIINFMIMIISFAVYAKESIAMPLIILIPLLISFFGVMIVCKDVALKNAPPIENNSLYTKSILSFIGIVSAIALIIPKPSIQTDREKFDTLISAGSLTSYLMSKLGDFSDSSDGTNYGFNTNNKILFYANAQESLNLKSKTFTNYIFEENTWYTSSFDRQTQDNWQQISQQLNPAEFINAVIYACEKSPEFAEKYGLSSISHTYQNELKKYLYINAVDFSCDYLLNPTSAFWVEVSSNQPVSRMETGVMYSDDGEKFPPNLSSNLLYYSDDYIHDESINDIFYNLNYDIYPQFLQDLSSLADNEYGEVVSAYYEDYQKSLDYQNDYTVSLDVQRSISQTAYSQYLEIQQLSQNITAPYTSDIEKALAIQYYFIENGFEYNKNYNNSGENIYNFIFDSKQGVCFSYASSMVIMARSIGIPARYCEGFMMSEKNRDGQYVIKDSNSHAYPELFISGCGWVTFEPTLSNDVDSESQKNYDFKFLSTITIILVLVIILAVMAFIILRPIISEKIFRRRILKGKFENPVEMIVIRISRHSKLPSNLTSEKISETIFNMYKIDISKVVPIFNDCVYGGKTADKKEAEEVFGVYMDFCAKLKEFKKNKKQKSHAASKP